MIVFLIIILLSPPSFAFASIEISEIMYDLKTGSDGGREWVEIYNNGDSAVDISNYRFFEGDTNHKLKLVDGSTKIASYGYALIVEDGIKFKIDHPSFSGNILDSTFSLNNSGEALAIKDGEEVVDQYTYTTSAGGAGDGKSLQKINGAWVATIPTPGLENKITYISPPTPKIISGTPVKVAKEIEKVPDTQNMVKVTANEPNFVPSDPKVPSHPCLFQIILVIFLILSSLAVFFVQKPRGKVEAGDDFELLED